MVKGFSIKKIKSKKTLGETFKRARVKKGITLTDAEVGSKVRIKYLAALEEANWKILPQDVYTRGFVLAYAKYLDLDKNTVLDLYEPEALVRIDKKTNELSYNQSLHKTRMLITPKIIAYCALLSLVIFMFTYIIMQVVKFAGNPSLKIITPGKDFVTESDSIDLSGITDADTLVNVNNESIPVTNDGRFYSRLKLHSGVNVVKVRAVNKARKETSEITTIEYKPKTASIENTLNQ